MKRLLSFACSLALATGAAAADPVLVVPFAASAEIGGKLLRTTLLVNNRGEVPRSFAVSFLPANAPPAARATVLGRTTLAPRSLSGCCRELFDLVPPGNVGMLEVRGAPQLRVSSILEVFEDAAVVGRIEVPAVRRDDLVSGILPFNAQFELDLDTVLAGFVHLGESDDPAICSAGLYKPEGGIVGSGVLVPHGTLLLEDLRESFRQFFSGELLAFGEFQCLQDRVFPFLLVVDSASPAVTFVTPARALQAGF